jgi:hypothetical protein
VAGYTAFNASLYFSFEIEFTVRARVASLGNRRLLVRGCASARRLFRQWRRWRRGFRLRPRSSSGAAGRKHCVSRNRPRRFVESSSRKEASSVPTQATWLRPNIFASAPALSASGLRLAPVRVLRDHRPNRAVNQTRETVLFPSAWRQ